MLFVCLEMLELEKIGVSSVGFPAAHGELWCKEKRDYDFVIRQVASKLYLIDLDEALVYLWKISTEDLEVLSKQLTRTLYFFEPGKDAFRPPLDVIIPSLATLSPYIPRIKEYKKGNAMIVYFWPWSSGELQAIIKHSKLNIVGSFSHRYYRFGGILRHVLGEDPNAETELEADCRV